MRILTYDMGYMTNSETIIRYQGVSENGGETPSWQWCISIGKCMIHHYGHIGLLDYWMFCFFFIPIGLLDLGNEHPAICLPPAVNSNP